MFSREGPKLAVKAKGKRHGCNGGAQGRAVKTGPVSVLAVLRCRQTAWKVTELAELFNVGRRSIYDLIDNGTLVSFRVGTAIRIDPADALELIEGLTTGIMRRAA